MVTEIVLLHFILKVVLVIIIVATRFLQLSINGIKQKHFLGDIIIGSITWTFFTTIIEGRGIIIIFGVMIISTTLIVDYVLGEKYYNQNKTKLKKKLTLGQALYLFELFILVYLYKQGFWGETESIVLQKISQLF